MNSSAPRITKAFGDRLLYENLTFDVPPGAIVGIISANGAGKTLFRMVVHGRNAQRRRAACGRHCPNSATSIRVATALDGNKTVWRGSPAATISSNWDRLVNSRATWPASPSAVRISQKMVGSLSGGRQRVHLANAQERRQRPVVG
ncbi:MAG: hypothetical protein R2856_09410 [Caldilineaceae bacterium]